MKYFLLIYNRRTGVGRVHREFDEAERAAALQARFAFEAVHAEEPDVEVVVLGSDSEDTLRATHSRYFRSVSELTATDRFVSRT
jgi:hypothetical protein